MPPEADNPQDPFSQIADKLKSANNVLVTVSKNPSVDQLAACIGLTLSLNKLGKHATAVFSGEIPSTIEFLEPEKTIETNTDSLRDFIIALDKAKADKLRYKVEDNVVKIFITPYKTSIGEHDLEFSQGDFNVDAVLALGVHQRSDLDEAIVAHGRILHDAAILSVNTVNQNELGSIDWTDESASSLCEMVSDIVGEIGKDTFDEQIATAFLTGIVAQTERFSNEKASPHTMSVSGILMAAGASTQLVASKLEAAEEAKHINKKEDEDTPDDKPSSDGTIRIEHLEEGVEIPAVQDMSEPEPQDDIHIDDHGTLRPVREYMTEAPAEEDDKQPEPEIAEDTPSSAPSRIAQPPQFGGQLTANDIPQDRQYSSSSDPMSAPATNAPILSRSSSPANSPAADEPAVSKEEPKTETPKINDSQTLSDIERAVDSSHLKDQAPPSNPEPALPSVDNIRYEVEQASEQAAYQPEPIAGLNAQDFGIDIGHDDEVVSETETTKPEDQTASSSSNPPSDDDDTLDKILHNSSPPPPVPPPMMPPVS